MNGTIYEVPRCGAFSTLHSHPSWAQLFASGSWFQVFMYVTLHFLRLETKFCFAIVLISSCLPSLIFACREMYLSTLMSTCLWIVCILYSEMLLRGGESKDRSIPCFRKKLILRCFAWRLNFILENKRDFWKPIVSAEMGYVVNSRLDKDSNPGLQLYALAL